MKSLGSWNLAPKHWYMTARTNFMDHSLLCMLWSIKLLHCTFDFTMKSLLHQCNLSNSEHWNPNQLDRMGSEQLMFKGNEWTLDVLDPFKSSMANPQLHLITAANEMHGTSSLARLHVPCNYATLSQYGRAEKKVCSVLELWKTRGIPRSTTSDLHFPIRIVGSSWAF